MFISISALPAAPLLNRARFARFCFLNIITDAMRRDIIPAPPTAPPITPPSKGPSSDLFCGSGTGACEGVTVVVVVLGSKGGMITAAGVVVALIVWRIGGGAFDDAFVVDLIVLVLVVGAVVVVGIALVAGIIEDKLRSVAVWPTSLLVTIPHCAKQS